ncbi:hypothetical protein HN51_062218 [Arachis hypogaea]|uniref:Pectinesterase inhibitor domain-containing protein n=2 Tax=Arachis hypogaea TaxID=3818 RepID=A0A445ARQ9_ARAHY|nr:putative invertase inhibitor [Arachis ipaensis]XP_025627524.1 putative invertase inhibitor [Arachis hypogaea]QHO19640.1 Putative invertase inhibitor [Arachis hypogaea]RYR29095.1 hypothetical protein Ahy_B01g053399 isoform A [Arachis hypogaea]
MLKPPSLFLLLLIITITPLVTCSITLMSPKDLVDQTCQKCANQSKILSYPLCSTSLPVIPVSHSANLQGLALIAMELALENVTSSIETIDKLLDDENVSSIIDNLKDCMELYSDAAWTIVNSIGAFLSGNYEVPINWMSSVMESASTCQQGFGKKGEGSPLTTENYNLFQLCGIAVCIIQMSNPVAKAS